MEWDGEGGLFRPAGTTVHENLVQHPSNNISIDIKGCKINLLSNLKVQTLDLSN